MIQYPTIMKFGGTSLQDERAIERAARIVWGQRDRQPVVIVSALGGFTDALLMNASVAGDGKVDEAIGALTRQFQRHRTVARSLLGRGASAVETEIDRAQVETSKLFRVIADRSTAYASLLDELVSYGERLSTTLFTAVLGSIGLPARSVDARRCIVTDDVHGRATPLFPETDDHTRAELTPLMESATLPVLGGFIGSTSSGVTTTLGRGGSDYTAALVGAALSAREIQIWTDVAGIMTADPRIVKTARTVPRLSYGEAAELAYFGAKVLHPKTVQPAVDRGIPIRIGNSREPELAGTVVHSGIDAVPKMAKALAFKSGITGLQITSARMLGAYGFLSELFGVFDRHRTVVDVVTTSEVSVSLTLDDTTALPAILEELSALGTVEVETNRAVICVVGEGLRHTPGIAARVFGTIRDINVSLISQGASSVNLTFVVDETRVSEAVTRLHHALFEESQLERPGEARPIGIVKEWP